MITKRQKELLDFIKAFTKKNGYCPSYEEMRVSLNLASRSGVHKLVESLEVRGKIKRLPNMARAIEVIK